MAKRRVPVVEISAAGGEGIPGELIDIDDPAWSSLEAASEWFSARGYDKPRGTFRPWYRPDMFHRQAVQRWAHDHGWIVVQGDSIKLDVDQLIAAGVPWPEISPELWTFPPGSVAVETHSQIVSRHDLDTIALVDQRRESNLT